MKKNLLLLALLGILALASCKKDLNFEKTDNGFSLTPEIGLPVLRTTLKMNDLLKEDSNIVYDTDGLIRFIYRDDSIAQVNIDTLVQIPDLPPVTQQTKLGVISLENFGLANKQTLNQIKLGFSATTQLLIDSAAGKTAIFPAINEPNNTIVNFPAPVNFNNINFSKGVLEFEFKNYFPVTINNISINVYSSNPIVTLIGTVNFSNILPGQSKKDSINLANKSLSNALSYNMPVFNSASSGVPVPVNLQDSLVVNVLAKNLEAFGGSAIFPSQEIDPTYATFDIETENAAARIKNIDFSSGAINYSMSSTIKEQINLKITFEGATKNGAPLLPIQVAINNNTVNGNIDLSDVRFNLGLDGQQPYNRMKVKIEPNIISSGTIKTFDSSDFVSANFTFTPLKFKGIDGYLGTETIVIENSSTKIDAFEGIQAGLRLDDPKIFLKTANSIGLPIEINLNIVGQASNGNQQPLNAPKFNLGYPTLAQRGQTISTTNTIDKTNSMLVDMIALPPSKINFGGSVTINKDGFNGYTDFLDNTSKINVGIEMDMPFSLKTSDFSLSDTADNPILNNGKILGQFEPEDVAYIELITQVINGFPFEGKFMLYFTDSSFNVIDSLETPKLLTSGIPDANGRVITTSKNVSAIRFEQALLKKIRDGKATKMLFKITLNTYNNGTQVVKVYSDYTADVAVSFKAKMKVDIIKPKNK
jgi:hypothetical protein